jgi:hypothetical protein
LAPGNVLVLPSTIPALMTLAAAPLTKMPPVIVPVLALLTKPPLSLELRDAIAGIEFFAPHTPLVRYRAVPAGARKVPLRQQFGPSVSDGAPKPIHTPDPVRMDSSHSQHRATLRQ